MDTPVHIVLWTDIYVILEDLFNRYFYKELKDAYKFLTGQTGFNNQKINYA